MPTTRSTALDALLSTWMNGLNVWVNRCSGRAIKRAVRSARLIAKIFGTCSPIVMCSDVVIRYASAIETP